MSYGGPCKLCKKHSQKMSNFGALSASPFNKIEFSIDKHFEKCFISIKAFFPKIQLLVELLSQNFCLPWIDKSLNDNQECEG